jgi:hypothetical protein
MLFAHKYVFTLFLVLFISLTTFAQSTKTFVIKQQYSVKVKSLLTMEILTMVNLPTEFQMEKD